MTYKNIEDVLLELQYSKEKLDAQEYDFEEFKEYHKEQLEIVDSLVLRRTTLRNVPVTSLSEYKELLRITEKAKENVIGFQAKIEKASKAIKQLEQQMKLLEGVLQAMKAEQKKNGQVIKFDSRRNYTKNTE